MIGTATIGKEASAQTRPKRAGRPRALVCAPVPPEFDRESGSRRIYHMIEFLREAGWTVAFVCENAPEESRHLQHLRDHGVSCFVGFGGSTPGIVEAGRFDVALFAFWYLADRYADLVRRLSPGTRIVVETVDLHWLRGARRAFQKVDGGEGALDPAFGDEMVRELNAYARADRVLTVSEKEAELVNDILGRSGHATAVPDCDEMPRSSNGFEDREGMLFVGNFRHPPNLDAVTYLCREILPLIPQDVRARHPLWIVGNGLDGRVRDAVGDAEHVRLVGWVPDLEPYLHAARISVVPLRYGAGTKRKLFQSLLAGTPAVTTPAGVEGMNLGDGDHLLVGETAGEFGDAVVRLLSDRALWEGLVQRGREKALSAHAWSDSARRFHDVMELAVRTPPRDGDGELQETDLGHRFRASVMEASEEGASVLVVSRGDPVLVEIPDRKCMHFPADRNGGYAGYHPKDSEAAIEQLESALSAGSYIAFPEQSFWWLHYYAAFARYLTTHLVKVWEDESAVVFRREDSVAGGEATRAVTPMPSHGLSRPERGAP